jgi:hypothetical protein
MFQASEAVQHLSSVEMRLHQLNMQVRMPDYAHSTIMEITQDIKAVRETIFDNLLTPVQTQHHTAENKTT